MEAPGPETLYGPADGEDGVSRIELIFSTAAPPNPALRRVAPPQVKMSLAMLPDGTIRESRWSFAVAYEVPEHRRQRAGADAISLLWDGNGWHVERLSLGDE